MPEEVHSRISLSEFPSGGLTKPSSVLPMQGQVSDEAASDKLRKGRRARPVQSYLSILRPGETDTEPEIGEPHI